MPRQSHMLSVPDESSKRVRVSPYPLRSTRTNNYQAPESPKNSELEAVRCVICMEPPHQAVLLICTSCISGCRPYLCDTSARHSNCFKQFTEKNKTKEISDCPLCRGDVLWTAKIPTAERRFMNAKPRCCPVEDCMFSGTYTQLDKHLKNEHQGHIPSKDEPERQRRWEQVVRDAEYDELMGAAEIEIPHNDEVRPNIYYPPVFQENIANGTVGSFIAPSPLWTDYIDEFDEPIDEFDEAIDDIRWRFISFLSSRD